MRWKPDLRSALIKHQAQVGTISFNTSCLFTLKPRLIPVLPCCSAVWWILCVLLEQQCPVSQCFFVDHHRRKFVCTLRSAPDFKALTDYLCCCGSCHTLGPGGPSLGTAQVCCVWSRGRTHLVHRPCSGAWTSLEWRFWSTGGTGWCPGLEPSSLVEPHPSRNLFGWRTEK